MEQESDRGPVVNCDNCLFCSKHKYGWRFCLALAVLLEGDEIPCKEQYFKEMNKDVDRHEQLVDAFRKLDE